MRVTLLSFGGIKTPGLLDALAYYEKLLKPWVTSYQRVELPEVSVGNDVREALARESEKLNAWLEAYGKKGSRQILVLSEHGKIMPTRDWAKLMERLESSVRVDLVFVIGSANGLAPEFLKSADTLVSLGAQTLSHDLAKVVLAEQLYRVFSLRKGHPYHREG